MPVDSSKLNFDRNYNKLWIIKCMSGYSGRPYRMQNGDHFILCIHNVTVQTSSTFIISSLVVS